MDLAEPILDVTKRLLPRCDLPNKELARRVGVNYEWLRLLRNGRIKDPSVSMVQRLHDFLLVYEHDRQRAMDAAEAIVTARHSSTPPQP
jgi:predicted transcriptional regulator